MTLEVYLFTLNLLFRYLSYFRQSSFYSANSLHSSIIILFEKYAQLLEKQFSRRFDDVGLLYC